MKIRTKLIINMVCFGAALLIIIGLIINTNLQVERLNKQETLAKNIEITVNEFSYLWNDYLFYHENQQMERTKLKLASISALLSQITVDKPEQQVLVEYIKADLQRLKEVYREVVPKIESAVPNQPNRVDSTFIPVSWSRMGVQTQEINFDVSRLSQLLLAQTNQTKQQNNLLILALAGTLVIFLLTDYLLINRRILKSILNLQLGTRIIGSGNLDFSIEVKKAGEIGELAQAFNQMAINLKTVIASKKDLEREIFKRSQAEKALRESEERYRTLFQSMDEGFSIAEMEFDANGKPVDYVILEINQAYERQAGLCPEEVLGRRVTEFLDRVEPVWFERYGKVVSRGEPQRFEEYNVSLDRWFSVYAFPLPFKNRLGMIFSDVTKHKQAENEKILLESYQRNNEILESITDSFYALDHQLSFIYVNKGAEKVWGIPRSALINRKISEVFPDMIDESLARFNRVLQEQTPEHYELYSKVTQRWVEMHVYPAYSGISVYFRDIDERRQMEESLRKSREAFSSERELLKVTINSLREGVVAIDNETRIIFLNEAAANLTGYSQEEAIGEAANKILYVIDDKTDEPLCEFEPLQVYNHSVLVTRDLREIAISINSSSLFNAAGQKIGTVLVFVDITEKQKTEQEMLKAAKLDSLGILAGGVAHDFNNVLAGILANLQLAMVKLKKHQDISNHMKTTIEITRKASDLTKQLLTFAKGGDPVKKSASITNLVKDTVQFALSGSKVKPEFHLPEDLWIVDIDTGQISQVINNLTINAEQAMPSGGILEIYGENVAFENAILYHPGQYVKLMIKDHGIGIPPEIIDKIFDPFFTTKKTGNGLGLSTSYSIIKKHDGYLEVKSEPGKGTAFDILLPVSTEEYIWNETKTEIAAGGEAKILLMDDEDAIRNVGGEMLFYYGYQVTLAKDGQEAVGLYKKAKETGEPFDVVIMDLTVPGALGGIETMVILRQFDPEIKAVISSGYASDPVMSEYEKYGFGGVVTKPYVIEELVAVLNKVLDRKQLPLGLSF